MNQQTFDDKQNGFDNKRCKNQPEVNMHFIIYLFNLPVLNF